jgi:uncharacterized protein YjiS (DUF1127 family)
MALATGAEQQTMPKSDRPRSGESDLESLTLSQRAELRAALVRRAHAQRQDAIRDALQGFVTLLRHPLVATWVAWRRWAAERQAAATLKAMTDAELSDMGLRRGEIEQKVRFPEDNGERSRNGRMEEAERDLLPRGLARFQERPRNPVASK